MGWSYAIVNGKEIGYSVKATCDHPGCDAVINRGVDYACGDMHGAGSVSCDGYFCGKHKLGEAVDKGGHRVWTCENCNVPEDEDE